MMLTTARIADWQSLDANARGKMSSTAVERARRLEPRLNAFLTFEDCFRSVRINPGKGEESVATRKPFVAIQRVQLPPGKGQPASRKRVLHGWWQHHS